MLTRENAPYLFTLIIATLGWLVTRAVDDMTKSPLVAYSTYDSMNTEGVREFSLRVHNISRSTAFRNLHVVLTNLDGVRSKFINANAQYEPPAYVSAARKTTAEWGATWAGILLMDLQPATAVRLATEIDGKDVPTVRCESATDTVHLVKEDWGTWITEHETGVLLWLAITLGLLLVFYVLYLVRTKPTATLLITGSLVLLFHDPCRAGTIRVIDAVTGHGVRCNVYREDSDTKRHFAGNTNSDGVYPVTNKGKLGEKYIAVSEEYNPAQVDCPVVNATIRVRKTIWLGDHLAKADFLTSVGAAAPAALELRKASLIAEEKRNPELFEQLEFQVAENAAKALQVSQPFAQTATGVRPSNELKIVVREYQKDQNLKPTGALNTDTLRELAFHPEPPRTGQSRE